MIFKDIFCPITIARAIKEQYSYVTIDLFTGVLIQNYTLNFDLYEQLYEELC